METMKIPNTERLVLTARRAAFKMKREYDRLQPDASKDECWAEQERLVEALSDFDHIYPPDQVWQK
jgi:hypothetical protein